MTGGGLIGSGIRVTGTGETARRLSAMKLLHAQTSSTTSNAGVKNSGISEISHHQRPMVWRRSKNGLPATAAMFGV